MNSSPYRPYNNSQEGIQQTAGHQEAMLIQDGYYSPQRPSYNGSSKHTPKSILKEYTYSGSKSKKGILINETLNETRKLSLRSETSESSAARNLRPNEQAGSTQNNRPQSAVAAGAHLSRSDQKALENNQYQPDSKRGLGSNWTSQEFTRGIIQSPGQDLSDVQKAEARKKQREREQEIYHEMVRKLNANQEEDGGIHDEHKRKSETYQENKHVLKDFEQKNKRLGHGESKRSLDSLSSLGYVEEKIQQLEKCLDVYSNRLRDSILRQRDQLLVSHYKKTGNVEDNISSMPIKNWEKHEKSIEGQENETGDAPNKKTKSHKYKKSANDLANEQYQTNLKQMNHWEGFNDELNHLRQQSSYLKSKLAASEEKWKVMPKQDEYSIPTSIQDKEMELLKTVEEIRTKLYNSISKRSIQERGNKSNTKEILSRSNYQKIQTRGPGVSKSTKKKATSIPAKYQKVREAYGASALERENACILNQGLSTTYNGFHWNADQSLKITRKE